MRTSYFLTTGIVLVILMSLAVSFVLLQEKGSREGHTPEFLSLAQKTGFELSPLTQEERSLLVELLPTERQHIVRSIVLLRDDDRVASAYWYQNPYVHQHLDIVRAHAFDLFSEQMRDLIDEAVGKPGFSRITVIAFTDPVLSEERYLFAVISDQIFEFHIAEGKEELVQGLLLEVARE